MSNEGQTAAGNTRNHLDTSSRYLFFTLSGEPYAIPLSQVKEVIGMTATTPLPRAPEYFKGLMNLRGQVIPVIDLRIKLDLDEARSGSETPIIIVDLAPHSLGVIVDAVDSVLALPPEDINAGPVIDQNVNTNYLTGIVKRDKKLVLLLDIRKTLSIEDLGVMDHSKAANN